jgi:Dehydrogenase E1 component
VQVGSADAAWMGAGHGHRPDRSAHYGRLGRRKEDCVGPNDDQLLWMYETMLVIRDFEERMVNVYLEGKLPPAIQHGLAFDIAGGPVPGEMHLAAGQEPVAVGVCAHLRDEDTVVGTHRPHHFAIAKGVPLDRMAAELFGKATGLSRGKGGHMHLFDPEHNFSCSGIEGASLPPATGAALAYKKLGRDNVAVAFFGEGAANQGTFHEALNLAGLWHLPTVFICEDNRWAISVPKEKSTAIAGRLGLVWASLGNPAGHVPPGRTCVGRIPLREFRRGLVAVLEGCRGRNSPRSSSLGPFRRASLPGGASRDSPAGHGRPAARPHGCRRRRPRKSARGRERVADGLHADHPVPEHERVDAVVGLDLLRRGLPLEQQDVVLEERRREFPLGVGEVAD